MLLNKLPGVYMVDPGNKQHSMFVRQLIGTKNLFLYLEDGIPIRTEGDFNHNALIEINQASMERIEVIKGPASSLEGNELAYTEHQQDKDYIAYRLVSFKPE